MTNPFIPTTFSTDAPLLHSKLADQGFAARMVFVTVDRAPVWHGGDIVARATGEFPAGYPTADSENPIVLLDDGSLSGLPAWNIEKERS